MTTEGVKRLAREEKETESTTKPTTAWVTGAHSHGEFKDTG